MKSWTTRSICFIVVVLALGCCIIKNIQFSLESNALGCICVLFSVGAIIITYCLYKNQAKGVANKAEVKQLAVENLLHTYIGITNALVDALDERAEGSVGQAKQVVVLTMLIGNRMVLDKSYNQSLTWGALLHDIGKIGIPEAILHKKDNLNAEEWAVIRKHSEIGYRMVQSIEGCNEFPNIILYHHEHYDGTGYPLGLAGLDIPVQARVVALADAVAAMANARPYRSSLGIQEIYNEVRRCSGTQFCPEAATAFLSLDPAEISHVLTAS